MFAAFLAGIIPGLVLTIAIGPVFFMLISTSIRYGFKTALRLEAGIISSDACCIALAYFGLYRFFINPAFKEEISWVGGLILLAFGLSMLFKKHQLPGEQRAEQIIPNAKQLFFRGFLFNLSNPSVWFFWMAAVALALTEFNKAPSNIPFYFSGILFTVLCTDIMKAYLAAKIRILLNPRTMILLDRTAGIGIACFGLIIILRLYL